MVKGTVEREEIDLKSCLPFIFGNSQFISEYDVFEFDLCDQHYAIGNVKEAYSWSPALKSAMEQWL